MPKPSEPSDGDVRLATAIGFLVLRTMEKSPFKREATIDVKVEDTYADGITGVDVKCRARRWVPNEQPPW